MSPVSSASGASGRDDSNETPGKTSVVTIGSGSERRTSGQRKLSQSPATSPVKSKSSTQMRRSSSRSSCCSSKSTNSTATHNDDQMSVDWTLNMRRKCCHFFSSSNLSESQQSALRLHEKKRPSPLQQHYRSSHQFANHNYDSTQSDIHYKINQHHQLILKQQDARATSRNSKLAVEEDATSSGGIRTLYQHQPRASTSESIYQREADDGKETKIRGTKLRNNFGQLEERERERERGIELELEIEGEDTATATTCYVNLAQTQLEARLRMQQQLVDKKLDCQSDNLSALSASSSLLSLLLNSSLNQLFEIDNGTQNGGGTNSGINGNDRRSSRTTSQSSTLCDNQDADADADDATRTRGSSERLGPQSGQWQEQRKQQVVGVDEKDLLIVCESTTGGGGPFHSSSISSRFLRRRSTTTSSATLSSSSSSSTTSTTASSRTKSATTSGRHLFESKLKLKRSTLRQEHKKDRLCQRENSLASSTSTLSATRDLIKLQQQLEAATSSSVSASAAPGSAPASAATKQTKTSPLLPETSSCLPDEEVSIKRQFVTSCPPLRTPRDSTSIQQHNSTLSSTSTSTSTSTSSSSSVGHLLESLARLSLNSTEKSSGLIKQREKSRVERHSLKLDGRRSEAKRRGQDEEEEESDKSLSDNSYKFKVTRNLKLTPPTPRVSDVLNTDGGLNATRASESYLASISLNGIHGGGGGGSGSGESSGSRHLNDCDARHYNHRQSRSQSQCHSFNRKPPPPTPLVVTSRNLIDAATTTTATATAIATSISDQHDSLLEVSSTFSASRSSQSNLNIPTRTTNLLANQNRRPLVALLDTSAPCPLECNCAQVVELNCPLCSGGLSSSSSSSNSAKSAGHEVSVTSPSSSSFAFSSSESFVQFGAQSSKAQQQHQYHQETNQQQEAALTNQRQISSSSSTSSGCCADRGADHNHNNRVHSLGGQRRGTGNGGSGGDFRSANCGTSNFRDSNCNSNISSSSNSPSASSLLSSSRSTNSSSCGVRVTATDSSEDSSLEQLKLSLHPKPGDSTTTTTTTKNQEQHRAVGDYGVGEARDRVNIMGLASSRQREFVESKSVSGQEQQVKLERQDSSGEVEELISELELCKLGVCNCKLNEAKFSASISGSGFSGSGQQQNAWLASYDKIRSQNHAKQSSNFYQLVPTSDNLILPITTRSELDPIFNLDPRDLTTSIATGSSINQQARPIDEDQSSMVEATAKLVRVVSGASSEASRRGSLAAGNWREHATRNLTISGQQVEPIYDVPSMSLENSPQPNNDETRQQQQQQHQQQSTRCLSPDQKYPRTKSNSRHQQLNQEQQTPSQLPLVNNSSSSNSNKFNASATSQKQQPTFKLDPSLAQWDGRGCPCAGCFKRGDRVALRSRHHHEIQSKKIIRISGGSKRKRKLLLQSRLSDTNASCVAQFGSSIESNRNHERHLHHNSRRSRVNYLHESTGGRRGWLRANNRAASGLGVDLLVASSGEEDLETESESCSCASDCCCSTCCSSETIVYIATKKHNSNNNNNNNNGHNHKHSNPLDGRSNLIMRPHQLQRRRRHQRGYRIASPITATSVCSHISEATGTSCSSNPCSCNDCSHDTNSTQSNNNNEEPGSLTEEYLRRHRSSRKSRRRLARVRRKFERHQQRRRRKQRHLTQLGRTTDDLLSNGRRSSRGGHGRPSVSAEIGAAAEGFKWRLLEEDEAGELMSPDSLATATPTANTSNGNGKQSDATKERESARQLANLINGQHANEEQPVDVVKSPDVVKEERQATTDAALPLSGSQSGQHDDLREREFKATGESQSNQIVGNIRLVGGKHQDSDLHAATNRRDASANTRRREGDNYYSHSLHFATTTGTASANANASARGRGGGGEEAVTGGRRQLNVQSPARHQPRQREQRESPPELAEYGNYFATEAVDQDNDAGRHRTRLCRQHHHHGNASGSRHHHQHHSHLLSAQNHRHTHTHTRRRRIHHRVSGGVCRRCVHLAAHNTAGKTVLLRVSSRQSHSRSRSRSCGHNHHQHHQRDPSTSGDCSHLASNHHHHRRRDVRRRRRRQRSRSHDGDHRCYSSHRHSTRHKHGHQHRHAHGENFRSPNNQDEGSELPSEQQRRLIRQLKRQVLLRQQHERQVAGDQGEQRQLGRDFLSLPGHRHSKILLRNRELEMEMNRRRTGRNLGHLAARLSRPDVELEQNDDLNEGEDDFELELHDTNAAAAVAATTERRDGRMKYKFLSPWNKATLGQRTSKRRLVHLSSTCSNGKTNSLRTSLFGSRRQVGYYNHHGSYRRSRRRVSATLSQLQAMQRELIASVGQRRRRRLLLLQRNGQHKTNLASKYLQKSGSRKETRGATGLEDTNDFFNPNDRDLSNLDCKFDNDVDLAAGDFIENEHPDFMDKFLVKKLSPQSKGRSSAGGATRSAGAIAGQRERKVRSPIGRLLVEMTQRKLLRRRDKENLNISTGSLLNWQLAPRCQCSHCCLVDKLIARDVETRRLRRLQRKQAKQN